MYLGYLCPLEEFHLYGYVSNTHLKIIVAVEEQAGATTAQPELQALCKQCHQIYANQVRSVTCMFHRAPLTGSSRV